MDRIARELGSRPPRRAEEGSYDTQAAVALMLRPTGSGLEFLAIKRAEHDRDPWSGHMALPGGRSEDGDADLRATAVRETLEEVGVDLDALGKLLGQLDDVYPKTRRIPAIAITPFVFAVEPGVVAETSTEVEHAVWVPLNVVIGDEHKGTMELEVLPGQEFPTIEYGGHVIWGLTLSILRQLEELLNRVGFTGDGTT
jgi:8-oxo-dGTP pyrophosphatase MutT (NUDIX family)